MKLIKLIIIFGLIIFFKMYLNAENLENKYYETKDYKVQITAMYNEPRLNRQLNLVEVAIYDRLKKNFWYEWFIIDGDKDYLLSEYKSNPELNISYSFYAGIKDIDINQFATRKIQEIIDVSNSMHKSFYTEIEHEDGTFSYFAYSRTSKETIKLRNSIGK